MANGRKTFLVGDQTSWRGEKTVPEEGKFKNSVQSRGKTVRGGGGGGQERKKKVRPEGKGKGTKEKKREHRASGRGAKKGCTCHS